MGDHRKQQNVSYHRKSYSYKNLYKEKGKEIQKISI